MALVVTRSATRAWWLAIASLPFLAFGADASLLPRLFPGYARRIDLLATRWGMPAPPPEGPAEIWGWLFLIAGLAALGWSLRELISPVRVLVAGEEGLVFSSLAGPLSGAIRIPWGEVIELAPAVLAEHGDRLPALALRVADAGRLPQSPWGALWVDDLLAIRAQDWEVPPGEVAGRLAELGYTAGSGGGYVIDEDGAVAVDADPTIPAPDPARRESARLRLLLGASFLIGAATVLVGSLVTAAPGGVYLMALGLGLAGFVFVADGYQRSRASR